MSSASSSPYSVPATGTSSRSLASNPVRILQLWHLLSLDAPTVAVLWSWAFANSAHLHLPLLSSFLLGTATWLLYVADRLLDAAQPSHQAFLKDRHHFHAAHRRTFLAVAIPAFASLIFLVIWRMDARPRAEDLVLAMAASFYLLCVHLPAMTTQTPHRSRWRFLLAPKELAVATIFTAATLIPAWSRSQSRHGPLFAEGLAFLGLCLLNCIAIEKWESSANDALHPVVRFIAAHFRWACSLLISASVVAAILLLSSAQDRFALLSLAIAASAFLLLHLDRQRLLSPLNLRTAVDAVLLTPLLFLLPVHFLASRLH